MILVYGVSGTWEFGIVFIVLELGNSCVEEDKGGKWRRGEAELCGYTILSMLFPSNGDLKW